LAADYIMAKFKFALVFLGLVLLALEASASGGYYYGSYSTPYGYYQQVETPVSSYKYESWPGYVNWEYYAPNGRFYSYQGPSYYGYYSGSGSYYGYYGYYGRSPVYSYPVVYYHAPYYNYYDYSSYYYYPGFSVTRY